MSRIGKLFLVILVFAYWASPSPSCQQIAPIKDFAFSDQQILTKVYDKTYKTPPGFFQDPALKNANHSLYFHQPNWFAADKDKARKIVEDFLAKPSGIKDKKIEETRATNKNFDFGAGMIWFRVHNPSYFAPKGPQIDSGLPYMGGVNKPDVIGTLNVKPLTKEAAKELAEYLWLIRFYNLDGARVLQSEAKEQNGKIVATLFTTQVVYGDFGLKDEISVYRETIQVDAKTGVVTRSQDQVRKLTGKQK